jgi:small subunit ribosomal protein S15
MARMHSRKKGLSGSKRPSRIVKPEWVTQSAEEIENQVVDLYKKGETPSKIGLILRDSYGIPLVKAVAGKTVKQILDSHDLKSPLPEDVMNLVKRALHIRKHLESNKKDLESKKGLNRVESKIYRLVRYYKSIGVLDPNFKYRPEEVKILIR